MVVSPFGVVIGCAGQRWGAVNRMGGDVNPEEHAGVVAGVSARERQRA
ncbi:hypothetical protein [Mycobacterium aquaticum]|nr:hypothetical protein [Mycobacterium aquaticum]